MTAEEFASIEEGDYIDTFTVIAEIVEVKNIRVTQVVILDSLEEFGVNSPLIIEGKLIKQENMDWSVT